MPQIGPAEILVVVLVALLVFGPHRLPEIGRQVGKGMREIRKLQETVRGELDSVLHGMDDTESQTVEPTEAPAVEPVTVEAVSVEQQQPSPEAAASTAPTQRPPIARPPIPSSRPAPRAPSRFRPPAPGPTT